MWAHGFARVAGLDEAGRGPLAGPVTAAAVSCRVHKVIKLQGLNDSKKLSEKKREELYELLTNHHDIKWGVGIVSEKEIDRINILQATKLAMHRALEKLQPDYLLIDGNFLLDGVSINQSSIIKGDAKVFSIAAASIIAKVTRDRIMRQMHETYPQYGFAKHKGYGTAVHLASIKKFGACDIHRKSFYPLSAMVK